MLRVKLSKLRQVCATAFIPRILKETKPIKRNIDLYSIEYLSRASKSTDSSSKDENYEKRKRIIDKCFAEKTPVLEDFQKNANDESLMKDNVKLYDGTTVDKTKSLISKIFGKGKEIKSAEEVRNAKVQDIAAKVEEVKLAHDIIHTKGAKDEATLPQNTNVESTTENSKVSTLLQNINVQTTTGDMKDVEQLAENIGHLDKIPHEHLNATLKVSDALENTDLQESAANVEKEKLAQHIVNIDKTPYVNIDTAKVEDLNIIPKVSETPQNPEIEATIPMVDQGKLSQHVIHIDKTPNIETDVAKINVLNPTLSESVLNTTTAKIEEEKLAQKIDHIDETPHVEAGVAKVEGLNVSPRVLGNDANANLTVSEPSSDPFSEQPEQVNIDELAKKCLGKPDGDIDQILLKELKNISRANSMKLNFPNDDSTQKYFSQIFENKSKDNNNIVFDISAAHLEQVLSKEIKDVTEMRMDQFHPFHLDTVPIVTTDTRKDECNRNYSPDGIKNLMLDIPAVLDPYDMQAIPFYQYVSKENIELKELQQQDAPTRKPPETSQETLIKAPMQFPRNAPMNEEVILSRDDLNLQEPAINNELKELEEAETGDQQSAKVYSFEPPSEVEHSLKSTETPTLSESDVSKLLEYKNSLSAQGVELGRMNSNIEPRDFPPADSDTESAKPSYNTLQECPLGELQNATQTVLTTTPADPFGTGQNDSSQQNTPRSNAFHADEERRTEQQTNTAISANQEPDEYFPTNHFNSFTDISIVQAEYLVTDNCVTYSGVFDSKITTCSDDAYDTATDSLISQSISYYSTFPQLSEFDEYYNAVSKPQKRFVGSDRITHVFNQPGQIQDGRLKAVVTEDVDLKSYTEDKIPLSMLLKRVRERNRLELIRSVKTETEVAKNPNCLPPLDKSKPKTTLNPSPCQPKPKEKESCKEPQPCKPPEKKDPCAKFSPFIFAALLRSNPDVSIPPKPIYDQMYTYISLVKEMSFKKFKHLLQIFGFLNIKQSADKTDDVVCARDFEPWVPIPSWPIPKVAKKKSVVYPKDGCKLPVNPVRSNTDKPCMEKPKKISPTKTVFNPLVIHEM